MSVKTKATWQKCSDPKGDAGQWNTPPANEGQIVRVSYAIGDEGVIYRRTWDQCDGSKEYAKRFLRDDEEFEPWQTEPA